MGIVNHDQPFDDTYSQDIIQRIRSVSTDLDEYVVTQQFLVETQEENLSPLWLRNRLLVKLVEQLHELGIYINLDTDDAIDQPVFVEAIITLFAKFGENRLYEFMKEHRDVADEVMQILDVDCVSDVVEYLNRTFPLDEGWNSIAALLDNRPGILRSTSDFVELISDTYDEVCKLGEEELVPESDMDKMLRYNSYLMERKKKISNIACAIYAIDENGKDNQDKRQIVRERMINFEKELSRPSAIREFIDGEVEPKQFVEQRRMFFLSKWKHCFEYWVSVADEAAIPSEIEAAILVATLYVDAPDPEHARIYVVSTFENLLDQFGKRYPIFRDIIDRALGNLVVIEKGVDDAIA